MEVALVCTVESPIAADVVSMLLFDAGASAVGEEPDGDHTILTAGFASVTEAEHAATSVEGFVSRTRLERPSSNWQITQRAYLEPSTVGPFRIRGPWQPAPVPDGSAIDLEIDPGSAFGHGGHPSTALLLAMLPETVRPGTTVADLGTGTGVLAIAAAKLGASVLAIELDPAAADTAVENIERNEVSNRVQLRRADAAELRVEARCVIANVTIDAHRRLAPGHQSAPTVLLAGVLASQADEAVGLYPRHRVKRMDRLDGWVGLWLAS